MAVLPEILQPPTRQPFPMAKGAVYMGLVTFAVGMITKDDTALKSAIISAISYAAFSWVTSKAE
jgi:hypothetical protein